MPVTYEINEADKRVDVFGRGELSMQEMIGVFDRIAEDARFQSSFFVIFDLREGDYTANIADGDDFVAALQRRQDYFQARCALVVPQHLRFLAKLYHLLAAARGFDRMRSFTDPETARAWCKGGGAGGPPAPG
jgi:hypothetical protein